MKRNIRASLVLAVGLTIASPLYAQPVVVDQQALTALYQYVGTLSAQVEEQQNAIQLLSQAVKLLAETVQKVDDSLRAELLPLKARPIILGCRSNFLGLFRGSCHLVYQQ